MRKVERTQGVVGLCAAFVLVATLCFVGAVITSAQDQNTNSNSNANSNTSGDQNMNSNRRGTRRGNRRNANRNANSNSDMNSNTSNSNTGDASGMQNANSNAANSNTAPPPPDTNMNGNMNANMSGGMNRSSGRRTRRGSRRSSSGAGMSMDTSSTPADLSGTYTGMVNYPAGGMSGDATLTINSNQFTLTSGSSTQSGTVTGVTTRGYTAVAMMFGSVAAGSTSGTTPAPTIISLRAKKVGDRLTLKSVQGETNAFSFTSGSSRRGASSGGRRTRRNSNRNGNMNSNNANSNTPPPQ